MNYPESLKEIINYFKLLPGVGEKTAIRYAFYMLKFNEQSLEKFSSSLKNLKVNIVTCPKCGSLCEKNNCEFCDGARKNSKILCVVENQKNVFVFEKSGYFTGKYHVLGGLISPMDGINPEDISIKSLIKRIKEENISEIILALRPGIEGNTTCLYIKKLLSSSNVKVTQIAQGIPIGADMEYLDDLTIEMAMENRNELE